MWPKRREPPDFYASHDSLPDIEANRRFEDEAKLLHALIQATNDASSLRRR